MRFRSFRQLPRRAFVYQLVALALAACCKEGVQTVDVALNNNFSNPSYVWLGDSVAVTAIAGTEPQFPCYRQLYTNAEQPADFTYRLTDASVVNMGADRSLAILKPGISTISATTSGVTSVDLVVIVAPPIASLRVSPSSADVAVGDTVEVLAEALDGNGIPVPGAQVSVWKSLPSDTVATLLPLPGAAGYQTHTAPVHARFRAIRPGTMTVAFDARHDVYSRNQVRPYATTTIRVVARPPG